MLWNFVPILVKSFSKAFAVFEKDPVYPNAQLCSSETFCFDYQSNGKDDHSGIPMSTGVRKRKWYKLCKIDYNFSLAKL